MKSDDWLFWIVIIGILGGGFNWIAERWDGYQEKQLTKARIENGCQEPEKKIEKSKPVEKPVPKVTFAEPKTPEITAVKETEPVWISHGDCQTLGNIEFSCKNKVVLAGSEYWVTTTCERDPVDKTLNCRVDNG